MIAKAEKTINVIPTVAPITAVTVLEDSTDHNKIKFIICNWALKYSNGKACTITWIGCENVRRHWHSITCDR